MSRASASVDHSGFFQFSQVVFKVLPNASKVLSLGGCVFVEIGTAPKRTMVEISVRRQMPFLEIGEAAIQVADLLLGRSILERFPLALGAHFYRRRGGPGVLCEQGAEVGTAVAHLHKGNKLLHHFSSARYANGKSRLQPLVSGFIGTLGRQSVVTFGFDFNRIVAISISNIKPLIKAKN